MRRKPGCCLMMMVPQFSSGLGSSRVKWFFLSSAGIVLVSLIGDYLLSKWDKLCDLFTHVVIARVVTRGIADELIHAFVAGWSWLNVWLLQAEEEWSRSKLYQILTCAAMASVLDIDHFLEAGSVNIQDAVNLPSRPFLHNTTLILILTAVVFALVWIINQIRSIPVLYDIPAMVFIAWVSHHLRDACRRGLWFAPFGSTTPHRAYIIGIVALPIVVVAFRRFRPFAPQQVLPTGSSRNGQHRDLSPA